VKESDLQLSDGRILHIYASGASGRTASLSVWHHGTSNTGAPPEPLLEAASRDGTRWVSYDRPGYGGSTPRPGRDLAPAAADASSVANALGSARLSDGRHRMVGRAQITAAARGKPYTFSHERED
jgi:pimeloyl-ACP methyl ester carboxylesterase